MTVKLEWDGGIDISRYTKEQFKPAILSAVARLSNDMETYAKRNARWTDRTGALRRGIAGNSGKVSQSAYKAGSWIQSHYALL